MNKKTIILCTCIALAFLGAIALGVYFLYSGQGDTSSKVKQMDTSLLAAIPSDAAAVMTFQNLERAIPILSRFCPAKFNDFIKDASATPSFAGAGVAASLHYNGGIVPLVVVASADSTVYLKALEGGFAARIEETEEQKLLLVSPSETIVSSSARHLGAGASILDNSDFATIAQKVSAKNIAFFSNDYADKIVPAYETFFAKYSGFLKRAANWTAIYPKSGTDSDYLLKTSTGKNGAYYMSVLESLQTGESKMGQIAPTNTIFALSISPAKVAQYHSAYQKYLDANQLLAQNKRTADELKSKAGTAPEQWASDIKEVASISWKLDDGNVLTANAIRRDSLNGTELEVSADYAYAGFAACEFGNQFSLPQEDCSVRIGNWLVSGSQQALEDLVSAVKQEEILGEEIAVKDCAMTMYYTSNDTKLLTFAHSGFELDVKSAVIKSNRTPELAVNIPEGPFEVTNSQTKKKNTFYQNDQLSLCLKDENGKGLWGVPFKMPICGYVSDVDYYNNGKIQFLFAAGSSLYLISRLGAFVQGFPVDLGKDILLGPAVYDFTGSKGYTVMVLHKDNTVEMYNLHGKKAADWKGITADDIIIEMPELVKTSDGRYWKVQTTRETLYFGFNGGEQIKDKKILNSLK